jgi:DNA-binding NarL/FixJ family response regulator
LKKSVRVLVVDDSPVAAAAICSRLEAERELEVVGTAKNGFELPEKAERLQPDVIIMDLHVPRMNGLEVALTLRQMMPETRFIIISDTRDLKGVSRVAGPNDRYFDKSASADDLVAEIRRLFPAASEGTNSANPAGPALGNDEIASDSDARKSEPEYC